MKNKYIGYLALVPFAVVVILYELLPLLQLVYSSLIGKESETFGLENFIKIFTTPLYQQAIINSVKISLISAIVGHHRRLHRRALRHGSDAARAECVHDAAEYDVKFLRRAAGVRVHGSDGKHRRADAARA